MQNANAAVHRQSSWSNLAHEMTAEFRSLCAEEVDDTFQTILQFELHPKFIGFFCIQLPTFLKPIALSGIFATRVGKTGGHAKQS